MSDKALIRIWTREEIDHLLIENDIAVMRAIVRLFQLQTADEISSTQTKQMQRQEHVWRDGCLV